MTTQEAQKPLAEIDNTDKIQDSKADCKPLNATKLRE